jgi:ABC-type polysaccharide/polyol phosphate transport system ATPase subunit
MTSYRDPELIKKDIKEIQKFTELEEYKQLKIDSISSYQSKLSLIFSSFAKEHPFLFRKVIMGSDLSIFYRVLEKFNELNDDEKKSNIHVYNIAIK